MALLRNNSFVLALALVAGVALGQGAVYTRSAVTPLLAVIMTLSLVGVSSDVFRGGTRLIRPAMVALFLNYAILGGVLLLLAFLLLDDANLRAGFVLIAAVPPAVAVIPFTYKLGGDVPFTLVGSVAGHAAAFVLTPVITLLALGTSLVQPQQLLMALLQLIAFPFLISRLLRRSGAIVGWLNNHRGTLMNWGFFVVVYTIIGLNADAFLSFSPVLLRIAAISFIGTIGVAYAVFVAVRFAGATRREQVSYAVMGAWKNYGLAGAIALAYFGEVAALPAAVTTAFAIVNFILLNMTIAVRDARL
jgi:BASS family bile acid:Na+ symporter